MFKVTPQPPLPTEKEEYKTECLTYVAGNLHILSSLGIPANEYIQRKRQCTVAISGVDRSICSQPVDVPSPTRITEKLRYNMIKHYSPAEYRQ